MENIQNEHISDLMAKASANEMEHSSFRRRLDALEKSSGAQTEILLTLQKQGGAIESMGESLRTMTDRIGRIDSRLVAIEQEPADKWKRMLFEIAKYIVLAALGVAVGYLVKR